MDTIESDTQSYKSLNSKTNQIRIEDINKCAFNTFKIFGLFLIKWDESECLYKVQRIRFYVYYSFWFLWPLAGLGLSLWGKNVFNSGDDQNRVNDVIETALFILGFAVVPALKTFAINLITRYLPEVLEDIASLSEMNVGFQTPLQIHLPSREQKSLLPKKAAQEAVRARKLDRSLFLLPIITVVVSILAFIAAWVWGLIRVAEWDTLKAEWPLFIMQFTYLTLPTITTWFNVIFIEWLRMVYEAMRAEAEYYYYSMLKILSIHGQSATAPLTEEKIKLLGDYADKLQGIFSGLSDGFIKYITGINFIVYLLSSVFCTVKLLEGFHLIIYMVPLSISLFHLGLSCYKSSSLMDEYHRVLSALKKVLRLERRNPTLLPYNELHILRENLLDSPPQVVIFGDFRVSNGFLIAVHGFILSYAVLANDVLNLKESRNICNGTFNM